MDINKLKKFLTKYELDIIITRFGLDGNLPTTLEFVSEKFKISKEDIRKIESYTLKRLQQENLDMFNNLENVSDFDKKIIKDRFGLNGNNPMLLEEIFEKYDIDIDYINELENRVVKLLKI